jgi:hypothetical protein
LVIYKFFGLTCLLNLHLCELNWLPSPSFFALPWVWLIFKSKFFRSSMFARPKLSWTWLTAKSKFFGFGITTRKLTNINRNTDRIFSLVYCSNIYQLNFQSLNLLVDTNMNIPIIYTEGIMVGKEGIKKKLNNTMTWSFIDDVTNGIDLTVKFIHEYADEKLSLVYIGDIMNDITMRFKNANHMVMWHLYRYNWRRC